MRKLLGESAHDLARDRAPTTVSLEIGECG
jgi:hypothetical protein